MLILTSQIFLFNVESIRYIVLIVQTHLIFFFLKLDMSLKTIKIVTRLKIEIVFLSTYQSYLLIWYLTGPLILKQGRKSRTPVFYGRENGAYKSQKFFSYVIVYKSRSRMMVWLRVSEMSWLRVSEMSVVHLWLLASFNYDCGLLAYVCTS